MVPRPEGLVPPGGSSDAENRPAETRDPVRFAVQLALAICLSPIFLVVCLVGGTSMLVSGMAQALRHGGQHPVGRPAVVPKLSGRGHGKTVTGFAGLDRTPDATR
jgi:hypothetical protein